MCGIAGAIFWGAARTGAAFGLAVRAMCDQMHARGPDASGYWSDDAGGIALGHRRLAIIDLDARASQPMQSADERYIIVFNGEIYNYRELRRALELEGKEFRTQSDTEVLLALYARRGKAMLPLLRGMFAFAIWDRSERELFVARDPYGIKPLYFGKATHGVLVASQVKALLATGLVSREPDAMGQAGFWLTGSVPEPRTWFRDIHALPAGHYATISAEGKLATTSWWDIGRTWAEAPAAPESEASVREHVRSALVSSVKAHLVADVPVGVFLSGGIDSGSLAALMFEAGVSELQAVTLSFREYTGSREDEVPMASRLARQLKIRNHVRTVTVEEFQSDLPSILAAMDQPTVDGINTWYASKAIAELGLKVVVSGVGGDELFQGYSSFRLLPRLVRYWNVVSRVPGAVPLASKACAWQAGRTGNQRWKALPRLFGSIEGAWFASRGVFSPDELTDVMDEELARSAMTGFSVETMVRGMTGDISGDALLALGQIESMTYLRNQLLRDSDWASMSHSVELRTPLVDAWLLRDVGPCLGSFHEYPHKRLLAEAPMSPLPHDLITRKKIGFSIPVHKWLVSMGRTSSRDGMSRGWARELVESVYGR